MLNLRVVIIVVLASICAYFGWNAREFPQPDGVLVDSTPFQELIPPEQRTPRKFKDMIVEPLARFRIKARLLSSSRYWLDPGSKISPIDLALGWGKMSDSKILKQISISQGQRFYYFRWKNQPDISEKEITLQSTNIHIIPANDYIKNAIYKFRPGQLVQLQGELVMISGSKGDEWKSSLTREDTGAGACELMWVTLAQVVP